MRKDSNDTIILEGCVYCLKLLLAANNKCQSDCKDRITVQISNRGSVRLSTSNTSGSRSSASDNLSSERAAHLNKIQGFSQKKCSWQICGRLPGMKNFWEREEHSSVSFAKDFVLWTLGMFIHIWKGNYSMLSLINKREIHELGRRKTAVE